MGGKISRGKLKLLRVEALARRELSISTHSEGSRECFRQPRSGDGTSTSYLTMRRRLATGLVSLATQEGEEPGPTTTTSYDRNYITERRARQEFLLEARDMEGLRITHRRSARDDGETHKVYWRKDIEDRAVKKWGTLEKVHLEREVREEEVAQEKLPAFRRFIMGKLKEREKVVEERLSRENWPVRRLRSRIYSTHSRNNRDD